MKREIIICIFWLLLSCYLSIESYRLGLSTANRPGPGFFPFVAAIGHRAHRAISLGQESFARIRRIIILNQRIAERNKIVLYVIAGMTRLRIFARPSRISFCTFLLVAFYLKVIAARRWPRDSEFRSGGSAGVPFLF